MDYIIRTLQSHHWGHCECTEHFLDQESCKEIGLENYEYTPSAQASIWVGTLSMSLQCICSIPAWYTTPFPQCHTVWTTFSFPCSHYNIANVPRGSLSVPTIPLPIFSHCYSSFSLLSSPPQLPDNQPTPPSPGFPRLEADQWTPHAPSQLRFGSSLFSWT